MNAAERFWAASKARDVDTAASELSPDVVMHNPATDDPIVGKDAVVAGLRAVEAACDEFEHTHLLTGAAASGRTLFGLVFEARIGDSKIRGLDLVELNEDDLIKTFTVLVRPVAGLMALGARMSGQVSRDTKSTT